MLNLPTSAIIPQTSDLLPQTLDIKHLTLDLSLQTSAFRLHPSACSSYALREGGEPKAKPILTTMIKTTIAHISAKIHFKRWLMAEV